jgi:hypothetical protein
MGLHKVLILNRYSINSVWYIYVYFCRFNNFYLREQMPDLQFEFGIKSSGLWNIVILLFFMD